MASGFPGVDVRSLDALLGSGAVGALADDELVERFASTRGAASEAAFAALVARHGPMVLGVCRRILGDEQAAEDAFQATFLVLARRAGQFSVGDTLGRWLHGVARRVAARARSTRRQVVALDPQGPSFDAPDLAEVAELRGAIDEEVGRLPGRLRDSVVLCLFEGLTLHEAAGRMGCAAGTAGSRLSRARDLLRTRLTRRGFAPSALALGMADFRAIPSNLSIGATARLASTGFSGAVPASVARLARSTLKEMMMAKLFAATALIAAGLGAGGAILAAMLPGPPPPPPPAPTPTQAPAAQAAATESPKPEPRRSIDVKVVGPDGRPLAGAAIHAGIWSNEPGNKFNLDLATDASGVARVELPKTYYILRLWASKDSFAGLFAGWEQAELARGQGAPGDYTFHLEPATTASGKVVDADGRPVVGAKVRVNLDSPSDLRPIKDDGRASYNSSLAERGSEVVTDREGRWTVGGVPDRPEAKLRLVVSHPDFVDTYEDQVAPTLRALRDGTAAPVALKPGSIVEGQVSDPDGKPISAGLVIVGKDPYFAGKTSDFAIGTDGRYRLPALPLGDTAVTVIAPGFAPQMRQVMLKEAQAREDFQLEPGKPIRLAFVDATGKPVPRVMVRVNGWKGKKSLHNYKHPNVKDTKIPTNADAQGVWEWTWAPESPVDLGVYAQGFADQEFKMSGGDSPRTVTLKPEHRVVGRVTDASTGQPIPSFSVMVVDVFQKDFEVAERSNAVPGKGGKLEILVERADADQRIRVEAKGYRTQDGPRFHIGDEASLVQDFALRPSPPIEGRIVGLDGQPSADVEVLLSTPSQAADMAQDWGNQSTRTDPTGHFSFPDPGATWAVIARSKSGFARVEGPSDCLQAGTIELKPWATVEGQFVDGGKPVEKARIILQPIEVEGLDRPRGNRMLQTITDASGRFAFPEVPPVPSLVRVYLSPWEDAEFPSGPMVPLDLKAGQRAELNLGGAGAVVTGKVDLVGKVPAGLDCRYSLNYLVRREPGIATEATAGLGFDGRKGWDDAWTRSAEGQAYLMTLHHWYVKLAADGSFRVDGVPAGDYALAVAIYPNPEGGCLVDPIARSVTRLTVTESDAASRTVRALPPVVAEVKPVPGVGDVADLAYRGPDGRPGTLADFRGRYLLVDFWASWCGACKQQGPDLRAVRDRFAGRGVAGLGLSVDEEAGAWQASLKKADRPWPQGRVEPGHDLGVSSVPAYWLIGPDGKIVARDVDLDAIVSKLDELLPPKGR